MTRDADPDPDAESPADRRCANCGDSFDPTEWYPVASRRTPDGRLRVVHFCSQVCKDDWLGE